MAAPADPMSTAIGAPVANATARSNLEPRLCYDDLRQWLEEARKLGEVKELSGLTWQQDIGMVASTAAHDDGAPCFVFEEVPGTIKGSRVLVNFFGGKRKNMTLGFATDLSKIDLSEGFRTNFIGPMRRIAPKYVDDGPIFENVMTGDDVDVTAYPAPKWHAADGGRYIGTGSFNVTRDPDEGWVNCGTYRVMIHDAKTAGFYISPGKHGRQMRDKYQARRAPMPRRGSLGAVAGEYREGGRARGDGGLGARGRQCAAPARRRRQPALSRSCQAGRPHRGHVPRRRLLRPLRDRGRRRHRRFQSRRAAPGHAHALGPRHLDRHHPQRLVDAARSAHRARAQGGRRPHQQPGSHRCLPALALARQVPEGEPAHAGRAPHGAGEVRPPVRRLIGRCA